MSKDDELIKKIIELLNASPEKLFNEAREIVKKHLITSIDKTNTPLELTHCVASIAAQLIEIFNFTNEITKKDKKVN